MEITPLSELMGVGISGVDIAQPLDQNTVDAITGALDKHQIVVLPKQTLYPAAFVKFSQYFGAPEPHVIDTFHHPVDPNILVLSNTQRNGKPIGLLDAGTYFHSDYSYLTGPARCTMLYAIQMPPMKCGTTFADQRRAFDDLPEATKARLQALIANHHYRNRNDLDHRSRTVASVLTPDQKNRVDWVKHPVVRKHPKTGQPNLYAISGSSFTIDGMVNDESLALLEELRLHGTQEK